MSLRGEIELTLPNGSLVHLNKTVGVDYPAWINIFQTGLRGSSAVDEVIGSMAQHINALPISDDPVTCAIRICANITAGGITVKYKLDNGYGWMIATASRSPCLRISASRLWDHIKHLALPYTPEAVECD